MGTTPCEWGMEEKGCPGKGVLGRPLFRFQGMHNLSTLPHVHVSQILCIWKYSNHFIDEETESQINDTYTVTQVISIQTKKRTKVCSYYFHFTGLF